MLIHSCIKELQQLKSITRNFDLEDVHVEGAERIADAVAKYDIDRFIHVSSYNADLNSPSEFFRTKVCKHWKAIQYPMTANIKFRPAEKLLFGAFSRKPRS